MTTHKVNLRGHLRSSIHGLIVTLMLVVGIFYINRTSGMSFDIEAFAFFLMLLVLLVGPSIYLHISYFLNDNGVQLVIDDERQGLTIYKSSKEWTYHFADVISVEQHIGIYYKNRIDHNFRKFTPWTEYGYILIKFNDGRQFSFTSLMTDVYNPPVAPNHTRFRFIPYLRIEKPFSESKEAAIINYSNEVAHYKSKFKSLTDDQLGEKILNKHTYEAAAVEAARQLLEINKLSTK